MNIFFDLKDIRMLIWLNEITGLGILGSEHCSIPSITPFRVFPLSGVAVEMCNSQSLEEALNYKCLEVALIERHDFE